MEADVKNENFDESSLRQINSQQYESLKMAHIPSQKLLETKQAKKEIEERQLRNEKLWSLMDAYIGHDNESIQR
jgi:hypothetical protein